MATITDFESWLDQIRPKSTIDVYSPHRAIIDQENLGRFHCLKDDAQLFLRTDKMDEVLMLVSDKAVKECLSTLRRRFSTEGDIRGWYNNSQSNGKVSRIRRGLRLKTALDQHW